MLLVLASGRPWERGARNAECGIGGQNAECGLPRRSFPAKVGVRNLGSGLWREVRDFGIIKVEASRLFASCCAAQYYDFSRTLWVTWVPVDPASGGVGIFRATSCFALMEGSLSTMRCKFNDVRGMGFLGQARRERRAYLEAVCEERATKPAQKRTAARRVAPLLAHGVVARRLQPHSGDAPFLRLPAGQKQRNERR